MCTRPPQQRAPIARDPVLLPDPRARHTGPAAPPPAIGAEYRRSGRHSSRDRRPSSRSTRYRTTAVRGIRELTVIRIDVPLPSAPGRLNDLTRSSIEVPGGHIDLVHPRGAMEVLYEQNFDAVEEFPPYWAELWPSSVTLAHAVATARPTGARILELGCGLGLPSIAAALAGGHVLATDRSVDALGFATYNAGLNGVSLEVDVCSWADPEPVLSRGPWDIVLAADVLYRHSGLADLADLLPRLVAGTGEVWLADPGRPPAAAFLEGAGRWARIGSDQPSDSGVTVHRLHPR
jgi:predicted nicotinamide N-methyase